MNGRFRELIRAGVPDPWPHPEGGGKGSAPAAPDYTGAAQQQAAASKEIATQQTFANRPEMTTPWGKMTWDQAAGTDPATGQAVTNWSGNLSLTPEQQQALDSQQNIQAGRSGAAETLLGQATGAFQTPFDWQNLPTAPGQAAQAGNMDAAQQDAFTKMSAMLQPGRQQQQEGLDTKLANMGLGRDSEAFKRAGMDLSNQWAQQDKGILSQALAEGRANQGQQYTQAANTVEQQSKLRQQGIVEEAQRRGMPLNELNALLTSQQVDMPNMPQFNQASAGQAPDLLGAAKAQGQYGMDAAQMNANAGPDIGSLIGTGAKVATMFSDARLKSNVRRIGIHARGIGVYRYTIFGREEIGVMAQELQWVAPHLVVETPSGYLAVNYGGL